MMKTKPRSYKEVKEGDEFENWTVIGPRFPQTRVTDGADVWYIPCRCDCGFASAVRITELMNGHSKSCGKCRVNGAIIKGHANGRGAWLDQKRLYSVWRGMKNRCCKEGFLAWEHYGGRGIEICQEWLDSFEDFRDWAYENGFDRELELDRVDNDGNYEPDNCRWVTHHANVRNTRQNRMVTAFGETKCLQDWAHDPRCKVSYSGMRHRLVNIGMDPETAITMPPTPRAVRRWNKK